MCIRFIRNITLKVTDKNVITLWNNNTLDVEELIPRLTQLRSIGTIPPPSPPPSTPSKPQSEQASSPQQSKVGPDVWLKEYPSPKSANEALKLKIKAATTAGISGNEAAKIKEELAKREEEIARRTKIALKAAEAHQAAKDAAAEKAAAAAAAAAKAEHVEKTAAAKAAIQEAQIRHVAAKQAAAEEKEEKTIVPEKKLRKIQVGVIGADERAGQVLAFQLKQHPLIKKIYLHGEDCDELANDLNQIDTSCTAIGYNKRRDLSKCLRVSKVWKKEVLFNMWYFIFT